MNINLVHACLDDIIIITKGSLTNHETELNKVLARLDKENLAISLQKCEFVVNRNNMAGLQNQSKWNHTHHTQNRGNHINGTTKNIKTT